MLFLYCFRNYHNHNHDYDYNHDHNRDYNYNNYHNITILVITNAKQIRVKQTRVLFDDICYAKQTRVSIDDICYVKQTRVLTDDICYVKQTRVLIGDICYVKQTRALVDNICYVKQESIINIIVGGGLNYLIIYWCTDAVTSKWFKHCFKRVLNLREWMTTVAAHCIVPVSVVIERWWPFSWDQEPT